jgi:hypothetical protein
MTDNNEAPSSVRISDSRSSLVPVADMSCNLFLGELKSTF